MNLKPYNVRIDVVMEDVIEIKAKNASEAIQIAESDVLASDLMKYELSNITTHYIVITTDELKETKTQIILNR